MTRSISFFSLLISVAAFSQESEQLAYTHIYRQDTIELAPFHASKVVSYKFDSAMLLVDLVDFKEDFDRLWREYRRIVRDHKQVNKTGEGHRLNKTWHFIDSLHQVINASVKKSDTIFLSNTMFRSANLNDMNNFFPYMIQKNRCTILDVQGKAHLKIIRQEGALIDGGKGCGGKRYFLIGCRRFFVESVDWET